MNNRILKLIIDLVWYYIEYVINLKLEILIINKTHKIFNESVNNGSK